MKQVITIIIIVAAVFAAAHYYDKAKYSDVKSVPKSDYIAKNGNYSYSPLKQGSLNHLKTNFNSGRVYRAKDKHPKVVIYTNVLDTSCPYRKNFQKNMAKYSKSEKWGKGYSFVSLDTHQAQSMEFDTVQEANDYFSFIHDCDYFCIIDMDKNLIFTGTNNSDDYVYDVLSAFYNN